MQCRQKRSFIYFFPWTLLLQSSLSVIDFLSFWYSYTSSSLLSSLLFCFTLHFSFIPFFLPSSPFPTSRKEDVAQTDHVTFLLQNLKCKQKHVRGPCRFLVQVEASFVCGYNIIAYCVNKIRFYSVKSKWKFAVLLCWNQNEISVITKICSICDQLPNKIDRTLWWKCHFCFHLHCLCDTGISHFQRTIAIRDSNGEQHK